MIQAIQIEAQAEQQSLRFLPAQLTCSYNPAQK